MVDTSVPPARRTRVTTGIAGFRANTSAICSITPRRMIAFFDTTATGSNIPLQYGSSKLRMAIYSRFPMPMLAILPSFTALRIIFSPMPISGQLRLSSATAPRIDRMRGSSAISSNPSSRFSTGATASASTTNRLPRYVCQSSFSSTSSVRNDSPAADSGSAARISCTICESVFIIIHGSGDLRYIKPW